MAGAARPWGVVLAGGRGSRIGGSKPTVELGGRPLFRWPAFTMAAVGLRVAVVVKQGSGVQAGDVIAVIEEPPEPVHALLGIVTALEQLESPVVVCPCDMPFVSRELLKWLADQDGNEAVVCDFGGYMQPLLGRYEPSLAAELRDAVEHNRSARAAIELLGDRARVVGEEELSQFGDLSRLLLDVDTPEDLAAAAKLI